MVPKLKNLVNDCNVYSITKKLFFLCYNGVKYIVNFGCCKGVMKKF